MRKFMLLCASLYAMAFVVPAGSAQAQTLAWVSPNGSDSNPCTQTSPCATFAGVINQVTGVTQINCEGSGDYGPVTIGSSLIIDCGTGNVGEITGTVVGNAINIVASSAATIVLRHLNINGGETNNTSGINTQSFASGTLIIEDCVIHGFHGTAGWGIYFSPGSGRSTLLVSNSLLYDNSSALGVFPNNGQIASVALDRVELAANLDAGLVIGNGTMGTGTVAGTMRRSFVAENGSYGVFVSANQAYFTVEESSIADNLATGIYTYSPGANVAVGASTIGGNATGVQVPAGSLISFGNNQMSANGSNGTFTSTTPLR